MERIEELDETSDIQAVVAAVRNRADEIRGNLGPKDLWEERVERADELMEIADRIDAASKRETVAGNAAKLREALEAWMEYWNWGGYDALRERRLKTQTNAALASTPRNCDVGTVKEQTKRFWRFCNEKTCEECQCPLPSIKGGSCELFWGQMPYEASQEGGRP